MTPSNSDPCKPNALTPTHFLVGGSLLLKAEPEIPQDETAHLRRWKFVQGLMQRFWKRWHSEYLIQLQVRGRWLTSKRAIAINDMVITKEDYVPPTKWMLGRIVKVHPGGDGIIRIVTLRTSTGIEMQRPNQT